MPVRDRDRLRSAFHELRGLGYWAYAHADTGWDAVPDDVLKRGGKVVFWHANETRIAFNANGDLINPLHLHHQYRDALDIAQLLKQYEIKARLMGPVGEQAVVVEPSGHPSLPGLELATVLGKHYSVLLVATSKMQLVVTFMVTTHASDTSIVTLVAQEYPGLTLSLPLAALEAGEAQGILTELSSGG